MMCTSKTRVWIDSVRVLLLRSNQSTLSQIQCCGTCSPTTRRNSEAQVKLSFNFEPQSCFSPQAQIKQIKPLLSASSKLGRALAELFGLLVKLCVGSPVRQRRTPAAAPVPTAPSQEARAVASAITRLLTSGLLWEPPSCSPVPKLRLVIHMTPHVHLYT